MIMARQTWASCANIGASSSVLHRSCSVSAFLMVALNISVNAVRGTLPAGRCLILMPAACALQEFVEVRRSALQHYMEQLAAHPVISRSEVRACTT